MRCLFSNKDAANALQRIANRTEGKSQQKTIQTVETILETIRLEGDQALIKYTELFDGFTPRPLFVEEETISKAWEETNESLKDALKLAHSRIKDFHKHQKPKDLLIKGTHGEILGRRWKPVEKAGIYIPGGRACYPSTVLMNAIPAQVAGVKELIMVSPANSQGKINNVVLAAAHMVGIKKVLRIGGAQAIGAMAFGTETIDKVDVITGPGNIYVTLAKKSVYGRVGIDSLAGPSEVLIIADNSANLKEVAADLLAQAEHDPLASSILLTTNIELANNISNEIRNQLKNHPRAEICLQSLKEWGLIVVCGNIDECIALSDKFAPEHLELQVENPKLISNKVTNAGAIFIGKWTPEAVGDYLAGPNHTLPTSGTARFSGALSVETFMKNTSIIEFNQNAFKNTASEIQELALSEGLFSHSESIRLRHERSEINPS